MSTLIKRDEAVFHLQPSGTQQAICYAVHDLGYQKGEYMGQANVNQKLILSFELNKRIESEDSYNGKRYTIHLWVTASFGKKANLPKLLEAWLNRPLTDKEIKDGFDVASMVGKNALLNIVHKDSQGKPKATIKGVMALLDGMPLIVAEAPKETPEWIKKIQAQAINESEVQAIRELANSLKDSEHEEG